MSNGIAIWQQMPMSAVYLGAIHGEHYTDGHMPVGISNGILPIILNVYS